MSVADATTLAERIRRGYVFARRGGESNFYVQRALSFSGVSVIELFGPGTCSNATAVHRAVTAENVVAASLVLVGARKRFLQQAIGEPAAYIDLFVTSRNSRLAVSSTSGAGRLPSGAVIDRDASERYRRNGFSALYQLAVATTEVSGRASAALSWLTASRVEPIETAAVVKTAIALEALLVSGREPSTRAVSERSAYLLSDDPDERQQISAATQRFYDVRSSVVHGTRALPQDRVQKALEYGDRMVVLLMLAIAAQLSEWKSIADVQKYCDDIRWGRTRPCKRPWRRGYLNQALRSFNL